MAGLIIALAIQEIIIYLFQFRGLQNMSEIMSRLKVGDIAPNFGFRGQHEKVIELENLKEKIVVIFFVRSLF